VKTRAECIKEYGSDYLINQMVNAGKLFRIDKGVFSETKSVPDLAVITFKHPSAVVTMDTAFYLYEFTDEIPDLYSLATKREAAPINDQRVKQVFIPKDLLNIGKTTIDYKGYTIPIFDRERMLIELVRYKSKIPYNYYKEILNNYRSILPQLNPEKIRDYAEAMPKKDMVIRTIRTEVY